MIGGLLQDDRLVQQEIFGPVITVQTFDDEEEALAWANGVEYGLASSVWTKDVSRALRVSNALDFGCVWINTHIPLVAEMPHGGFKSSGPRQGPVDVRAGGLHPHQARDGLHGLGFRHGRIPELGHEPEDPLAVDQQRRQWPVPATSSTRQSGIAAQVRRASSGRQPVTSSRTDITSVGTLMSPSRSSMPVRCSIIDRIA